jgi:hypothetical protein
MPPSPAALQDLRNNPIVQGLSDQEVVLAYFLYYACVYEHLQFKTETIAELKQRHREFLISTQRLQEEAKLLRERWSYDPEAELHATAIDAAISFHSDKTKKHFKPQPRLVDRNQGNPHHRAYALYMASATKYLFGKHMYGTIAAVTNVALVKGNKLQVSQVNVRDWCRASMGVREGFGLPEF